MLTEKKAEQRHRCRGRNIRLVQMSRRQKTDFIVLQVLWLCEAMKFSVIKKNKTKVYHYNVRTYTLSALQVTKN
jgi:hypothetical protein